jgi:hypothetical protein
MSDLREALLSAHVQHELASWRGSAFERLLRARLDGLFRWLGQTPLDRIATRAQIMGVVDRHVIELRVSGGITELAGEMARIVFSSKTSAHTRLDQLLDAQAYDEFASKISALEGVRREVISLIARSEAFGDLNASIVSRSLLELLLGRASHVAPRPDTGLSARLQTWMRQLHPVLEQRLGGVLARHLKRSAHISEPVLLAVLDPEQMRAILDDLWDSVSSMPLSDAFSFIGEHDLEDFVVLGYEFWARYRKTPYFRQIVQEQVDHFFDKYGPHSVLSLIDDMGVSQQMVLDELLSFLQPLLDAAAESGFLEQTIRAHLEPFYRSAALAALLPD